MLCRTPRISYCSSARHRAVERLLARRAVRDQLGEQRIVVHRDRLAFAHAAVDADAGAARLAISQQPAGLRQQPRRVLGVDAALDRVAARPDVRPA